MTENATTAENKEKLGKMVKVLKELEEKYKKLLKDKNTLCDFIKNTIENEYLTKINFDTPVGQLELSKLIESYKKYQADKIKDCQSNREKDTEILTARCKQAEDECKKLEVFVNSQKNYIISLEEKFQQQQRENKKQEEANLNNQAATLLTKLKKTSLLKDKTKNVEELEAKIREQADIIYKLKSEISKCHNAIQRQRLEHEIERSEKDVQVNFDISQENQNKFLELQKAYEELQSEFLVI